MIDSMLLRDKFTDCEGMKFHDGGGGMVGYPHHNLMDMYPGPAINTMDWKNTSQVSKNLNRSLVSKSEPISCALI